MAIVNERLNVNKPPTPAPPPGKLAAGQINNSKDLDVDPRKEETGFFGSFFSSTKGQPAKKKGAGGAATSAMDAVSAGPMTGARVLTARAQPPTTIKPQAGLNDRESMETEVISTSSRSIHFLPPRAVLTMHCAQSCSSTLISTS